MKYSLLTHAYEKIESTSKRLEMTNFLVELIKKTPKDLIRKVAYLTQGKIYPDFMGIEIGMATKMAITSIAKGSDVRKEEVNSLWKKIGDLGLTAEELLKKHSRQFPLSSSNKALTVLDVYGTFNKISKTKGKGAVKLKVGLLTNLIVRAEPREAKYIIRSVIGRLRLGVGDMTFLDALAVAYGSGKDAREAIERAYNMSSDLGLVSETLAKEGIKGIKAFGISLGRPIRPMLCERMTKADEILEKLGGKAAAEFKYDGLRVQAHISIKGIELFSRRLENITSQFPDISLALRKSIKALSAVVEGECVAIDQNTGELLPFQVVTHRRGRKYQIEEKTIEIPVVLVLFDILFLEDKTLVDFPYMYRREVLEKIVQETEGVKITHPMIINNSSDLNQLMDIAIEAGCEGLVLKSISSESFYQAGSRGFLWIKYKRDYRSEMADTIDLVVVGAFAGRGRRAGTYGALLMATYNEELDSFETISKLGTGFDDETLSKFPQIFSDYRLDHVHPRVVSKMKADYWFIPWKVLEVKGAELTLSPSHTCGLGVIKNDRGFAIRFPRFTGKWRDDKAPEDATTVNEIVSMYKSQLRHME